MLPELSEQISIGAFFKDLDTTIKLQQLELKKYENIKQGMMEDLLTGKVRLV